MRNEPLNPPTFDCHNLDDWNAGIAAQKGDDYGLACFRYAAKWASLLDALIAESPEKSPELIIVESAEKTSHDADEEGITGFMYGMAVSILVRCWRHGGVLRRWHNRDIQIGTEGDKANANGGVLNPALLEIG